ncbi:hypothetical protein BDFB_013324 [Asbolus verrucosus]|uniref:Uncharacterized protein n=1 Tax=Asbolus verrucosus TaxID=1661398 RepID=A0A482W719_ASBVE|nr:hypothetical protein BDFB_013324 [Asbolus verrucosus]
MNRVYSSPSQIKKTAKLQKRIYCNIRLDLTEIPKNTIKLREKQIDEIKTSKKGKKKYCDIKFSPTQIRWIFSCFSSCCNSCSKSIGIRYSRLYTY